MKLKKPVLDYSLSIKNLDAVTYLVKGQNAWEINEVAERICLLSDGKNTVSKIINEISKQYSVDENEIETDCMDLIEYLNKQNLIKLH
ncbi:PqqD family protein [Bacillus solimangrovi]|uniref:Pyrroloquinoline quinone biosynthesis protein PqqD n=1 Tax=Bacillus solimangrovi TaxID=1305675 RepID=A0A1E5LJL0_9BACI|nr:PqqD family protein [Bacillus solimangrovi]OEH94282.1 hypothetical protein BFG57_08470 [Bacillus solimangrovi]